MKKDSTRDGKLSRTGNVQEVNLMNKSKKVEEPKKKTQIKVSSFMEPISDGEYNEHRGRLGLFSLYLPRPGDSD